MNVCVCLCERSPLYVRTYMCLSPSLCVSVSVSVSLSVSLSLTHPYTMHSQARGTKTEKSHIVPFLFVQTDTTVMKIIMLSSS